MAREGIGSSYAFPQGRQDISIRLETSGGATPAPDLAIVDTGSGLLTLQGPGSDLSQSIARTASPSHVVRTVARAMVTSKTP